jgi:type VI protein secretion system component VasF
MDADDEARPSLVSRIPGWLIVAVLVAAFVMGVFFMQWAE